MPENKSQKPLLLILDGHAMVFRAWFSIPERLSTSTGQDTRGAYGFLATFLKIVRDRRPTHVAVAFDTRAPTFRDAMFAEYKAQRPPVPDDLHAQFPLVKKILAAFKIPVYEKDGYEADDVVGTIARICEEQGADVLIVTGDADQLQLVNATTKLLMYTGFGDTRVYDIAAVKEKYGGLGPERVPDIKAITGDPSDNIKGVPGLGEKSAIAVLTQFGTIENTLEHLDDVEGISGLRGAKRVRTLLEQHREAALHGKKLTTIVRDAPVDFDLGAARFWQYDRNEVIETLLALEFRSIVTHVPDPANGGKGATAPTSPLPPGEGQGDGRTPSADTENADPRHCERAAATRNLGRGHVAPSPSTGEGQGEGAREGSQLGFAEPKPVPPALVAAPDDGPAPQLSLDAAENQTSPSSQPSPAGRRGSGAAGQASPLPPGEGSGEGRAPVPSTSQGEGQGEGSQAHTPSPSMTESTGEGEVATRGLLKPDASAYHTVTTRAQLNALVAALRSSGGFAFDTETTGIDPMRAELVGLSFSTGGGAAWYVPVGHKALAGPLPTGEGSGEGRAQPTDAAHSEPVEGRPLTREDALASLRPVFADATIPKYAHNANYDLTVLAEHGIDISNVALDSMIAASLVGRRAIGLKDLALEMFKVEMTPITDLIGTGRKQITMDRVPVEAASPYACADADFAWRVQDRLRPEIDRENAAHVLNDIEMPLLPVIVGMQRAGVLINRSVLSEMSEQLAADIAAIEHEASGAMGGRELNLNANQQIAALLFDELGVPRTRRTKTGFTMDANALEALLEKEDLDNRAYHLIKAILKYREYSKLKSTYVDTLPELVHPRTGRVHTSFNQVGSATGRLSSTNPNIQNIPVRTDLGKRVRSAFMADHANGWLLLSADYSQIELRILAHLSQEPHLLEAFKQGEDIHNATARAMYGVEKVTPDQRRIAKVLNFGVIYGLGAHGVAVQTDLTRQQGQQFIDMYFGKYPGVRDYIERVKSEARRKGYAETVTGRRRRLPELRSPNQQLRAAGERMAINMPVQGTAADVIKIAMINIDAELKTRRLRSRMTIQVHDELIFEVAPGEMDEVHALVTTMMPAAMSLTVPLNVEAKHGRTWGDME